MAGARTPPTFTPDEIEFLAEDEEVAIVPNFRQGEANLMGGSYGPFRPQIPCSVPLWLAVLLKSRGKCTIQPPAWMEEEHLAALLDAERASPRVEDIPFHYLEVSQLLLRHAKADIPSAYRVRSLLEDLRAVRAAKIQASINKVAEEDVIKITNLSAMEINNLRQPLLTTLNRFQGLEAAEAADKQAGGGRRLGAAMAAAAAAAPAGGAAAAAPRQLRRQAPQ